MAETQTFFCGVADAAGTVVGVHPQSASSVPIIGRPLWQLDWWEAGDRTAIERAFRRAVGDGVANLEVTCRAGDGRHLPVDVNLLRFQLNNVIAVLISATRQIESEAVALLYGASHDLHEPLRMIHMYAQLLERKHGEQLSSDGQHLLSVVIGAAKRMKESIGSLLTYSRLDLGGAENLVQVDAQAALHEAELNLRALIEETGAEIKSSPLPTVAANPHEMVQLFQNLLNNAIKYRKESTEPKIRIDATPVRDGWQISVRDEGIGFPPQQADNIFGLFTRLNAGLSGTGLGLAICRRIVTRMGGQIWAESEPGKGSVFHFTCTGAGKPPQTS